MPVLFVEKKYGLWIHVLFLDRNQFHAPNDPSIHEFQVMKYLLIVGSTIYVYVTYSSHGFFSREQAVLNLRFFFICQMDTISLNHLRSSTSECISNCAGDVVFENFDNMSKRALTHTKYYTDFFSPQKKQMFAFFP